MIVFSEGHLRRVLAEYFRYYHRWRTHLSLGMDCPYPRRVQPSDEGVIIAVHPIIKAHYYHPAFNGSYSIKGVLPAVVPNLAYNDLEIQEGTMASVQFHRMALCDVDATEKARIRTALLKYCERDTLAMVELRQALRAKA